MTVELPVTLRDSVRKEWVDPNGHFNMGYYAVAYDLATDGLFELLGCAYVDIERTGGSVFLLELHVNYLREMHEGDPFRITSRILDHDAKRIHVFGYMHHEKEGFLSSTAEMMLIHVDMKTRKSALFPADTLEKIRRMKEAQDALPWPPAAGRAIGLKQRKAAAP